ncbi:MAG: hypothetical protein ACI8PB_005359 [Desulforhopalus sp.]|jgi:hypothetical protein
MMRLIIELNIAKTKIINVAACYDERCFLIIEKASEKPNSPQRCFELWKFKDILTKIKNSEAQDVSRKSSRVDLPPQP